MRYILVLNNSVSILFTEKIRKMSKVVAILKKISAFEKCVKLFLLIKI